MIKEESKKILNILYEVVAGNDALFSFDSNYNGFNSSNHISVIHRETNITTFDTISYKLRLLCSEFCYEEYLLGSYLCFPQYCGVIDNEPFSVYYEGQSYMPESMTVELAIRIDCLYKGDFSCIEKVEPILSRFEILDIRDDFYF